MNKTLLSGLCWAVLAVVAGSTLQAQSYVLNVTNGYGSGTYQAGDTVDIWCSAIPAGQVFDQWTGDTGPLESKDEWHTTFVMPSQNLAVAAVFRSLGNLNIQQESIMGRDTLKEVYSFFPPNFKGVIFCFHGTGGAATNWVSLPEYRQFLNDAVADTFAVVITEAEEVTRQVDLDGDGKLRWALLPYDSATNVDMANIRILIDTFRMRGILSSTTRLYAVGMSNGGGFAPEIATLYHWAAAVSYCAQSSPILVSATDVPIQWCMARYDNHPNVGPQGNADALADYHTLAGRGICTNYFLHDHSPVYPERFMRDGNISSSTANQLFNELQNNHLLSADHYLLYASDTIAARILAAPFSFPVFLTLPAAEKVFMSIEVDAMYAAHQFFSDYNKRTLHFFNDPCSTFWLPNGVNEVNEAVTALHIYPNPTADVLHIESEHHLNGEQLLLMDITGKTLYRIAATGTQAQLSLVDLPAGIYLLKINNTVGKVVKN